MLCKGGQVKLIDTPHNQGCQLNMPLALALLEQNLHQQLQSLLVQELLQALL